MHATVTATKSLFVVADLARSLRFYCEQLGFRDPSVWGHPPCFAMIHRDGFDLMLSVAKNPGDVHPNGPTGAWDLYLNVTDIECEANALHAAGVPFAGGPRTTDYGMAELEVLDPDGHRICFGQPLTRPPVT